MEIENKDLQIHFLALQRERNVWKCEKESMHKNVAVDQTKRQKQESFRIYARKLFLTFNKVDPKMSLQDLLENLESKFSPFDYVIGKEFDAEGKVHFHAILVRKKKFNIRRQNLLYIQFQGQTFHGKYQPVTLFKRAFQYVCKDKEYITNYPTIQDEKIVDDKIRLIQRAQHTLSGCHKWRRKSFTRISLE